MMLLNNFQFGPVRDHPIRFPVPPAQICSGSLETWSCLCGWLTGDTTVSEAYVSDDLVHLLEK